jgi:outer membrane biosynthesis protein TonB
VPPPKPADAPRVAEPAKAPAPDPAAITAAQQAQAQREQQQAELYNQYLVQVRKQVLRNIEYPRRAQKEGVEGLVVLRLTLAAAMSPAAKWRRRRTTCSMRRR